MSRGERKIEVSRNKSVILHIHNKRNYTQMELQVIDYIVLVLMIVMVIWGFVRGIVCQIGDLAALVLGIICSHVWGGTCAAWLQAHTSWEAVACSVIAYIGLFLLIYLTIRIMASFIKSLTKLVRLGWMDSVCGAFFGAFKLLLFASMIVNALLWIAPHASWWHDASFERSVSYPLIRDLLPWLLDAVWQ